MICNEAEELITGYLEDALPASRRADFEAHLETCSHCQTSLGEMRAVIEGSHALGVKLRQDWRARSVGNQDQFLERLEARALKQSRAPKSRYRRLAPAAAVVAVVAIAAGVWVHVENARRSAVPLNLTVDLTQQGPLRGAEQPKEVIFHFPQRILNLQILMPIGSEPGDYGVAIWHDGKILVQGHGPGTLRNGITTVRVQMDCRHISKGSYKLLTRFDHWSWENFPLVVR
jgi:hypothetical protein